MTESVTGVAKEEITRQTVILIFSIAGVAATVWAMQGLSDPDTFRTVRMGTLLWAKRLFRRQADRLQEWADKAATAYNREKA